MLAYLFAGQGSQYIGMGKDFFAAFPESRAVFDRANQVLGFDLKQACFSGAEDCLKKTEVCQPAVLTTSIAAFEAFKSTVKPDLSSVKFVAGLSLGEYSALVACGALKFEDALKLVRRRAELMSDACVRYPGKMAAIIGLEKETVKNICLESGRVGMANLNCPGQIVISGEKGAVDRAKAACEKAGAKKAVELEVSGAFHSELMHEAAMEFASFLDDTELVNPKIPVVSNVDALPKFEAAQIRENMVKQIYSPVLWEDSMRFIIGSGVKKFYEFGPGKVLKGLMRKIDPGAEVISVEKKENIVCGG